MFLAVTNLPLLKLNSSYLNKNEKLTIEYLNRLPENDYIIGSGDTLNIIISRDLNLSSEVTIDGEGTIYLPKLERVNVSGLSINELNSLLNQAYLKFLKYPNVQTIITKYRPINVFIEGEVVNPGIHRLQGSLSLNPKNPKDFGKNLEIFSQINSPGTSDYFPTVFDAIRAANGITQYSDLKNIQVIRRNNISRGSGKITTTLNFEDLLIRGEGNQNIRIYDSDIIKVQKRTVANKYNLTKAILSNLNPKFINVFVSGRVNRPGSITLSRASVLSDAIDMAGGAKIMRGPVTFIRFLPNGSIDKRKMRLTKNKRGKFNNPNLINGDMIIVGENIFTASNQVIKEITSPFIGLFSTYGLIKALSD